MADWELTTKKRGVDDDDLNEELQRKRASLHDDSCMFKFLVPLVVCGAILGKGGTILAQAAQTSGARIKLSQNKEFFPGTNDRVLSVTGSKESCVAAAEELVARILEAFDKLQGPEGSAQKGPYTMRVLIPNAAAGVMIGRAGAVIKRLSEVTSCKMQLGDMTDPFNTKERIMIINSSVDTNLVEGVKAAMSQFFSEPTAAIYTNPRTTYGPAPGAFGPGGGPGGPMGSYGGGIPGGSMGHGGGMGGDHYSGGGGSIGGGYAPQYGGAPAGAARADYGYQAQSAGGGAYNPALAGGAVGAQAYPYQLDPMQQQQAYGGRPPAAAQQRGGYAGGAPIGQSPVHVAAVAQQTAAYYESGLASLPPHEFTQPLYTTDGDRVVMEMGVADSRLGSLLGRGGHIVKEIMSQSGCIIQVSQKDVFLAGTTHRSVKCTGKTDQIHVARQLIYQKIQEGLMSGGRR